MKIAIFRNTIHGFESVLGNEFEEVNGYIRLSEFIDVEFVMLDNENVSKKEVNILREEKKKIQVETELKLSVIDSKIGELLALPPANNGIQK